MNHGEVARLTDSELEAGLHARIARDRHLTVELLLFLGEMTRRRLFAPAGYTSMYQYCVQRCGMSADVAFRWTRVAKMARRFPMLLEMIADGRLGLTAITLLAPRLDTGTAPWLLSAAAGKSTREVAALLARHWPRPDAPTLFRVISETSTSSSTEPRLDGAECQEPAALPVSSQVSNIEAPEHRATSDSTPEPTTCATSAERVPAPTARRYVFQCTVDAETFALFERARSLAPANASSEVEVLKTALAAHVLELEWRRFAATASPRTPRASSNPGHIPHHVRRSVWMRDRGRCAFVGEDGHRCGAREQLEFDHVVPVARGGDSRPGNLRLLCRTHNQLVAERVFGREFMERKRRAGTKHTQA